MTIHQRKQEARSNLYQRAKLELENLVQKKQVTEYFYSVGFLNGETDLGFSLSSYSPSGCFDLASLTKPLALRTIALEAYLQKPKEMELAFLKFISFEKLNTSPSMWDYLNHESLLPPWFNFWIRNAEYGDHSPKRLEHQVFLEWLRQSLRQKNFEKKQNYSDLGPLVLGLFLETFLGKSLPQLFEEFKNQYPKEGLEGIGYLGFVKTPFFVETSQCLLRKRRIKAEPHDENAASLGGWVGHAGLFASGPSLDLFLRLLWEKKRLTLTPIDFLQESKRFFWGWDTTKVAKNAGFIGHWGFSGTGLWFHVETGFYWILLLNRVFQERRSEWIMPLRKKLLEEAWGGFYGEC